MELKFGNIRELITQQGQRYANKTLIRFYDDDITYQDMDMRSSQIAAGLHKLGVKKGDRVCILMDNSPEFYYAYFGIIRLGAIAGPVNCWWQTKEIQYLLSDSGAVALFVDTAYRGHLDKMKGQTPALKHFIKRGAQDADLSYESMLDEKDSAPEETIDLECYIHHCLYVRYYRKSQGCSADPREHPCQLLAGRKACQYQRERCCDVFSHPCSM